MLLEILPRRNLRGTQDRYSPSAEILRVSRIPIGGSQLSDKPASRLPLPSADRLASRRFAAAREDLHFLPEDTKTNVSIVLDSSLLFHKRVPFVARIYSRGALNYLTSWWSKIRMNYKRLRREEIPSVSHRVLSWRIISCNNILQHHVSKDYRVKRSLQVNDTGHR